MKFDEYLRSRHIPFGHLHHRPSYTAKSMARILHVPGQNVAKTVLLRVDGKYVIVVLPATQWVDLQRVREILRADKVELATEKEISELFPDCEGGVVPTFGSLYHLPTLVDKAICEDEEIFFESQNHHEAIRMKFRDYQDFEHPRLGRFAFPPMEEIIDNYSTRLTRFVEKNLPNRLRRRVDPEDIVQSVLFRILQSPKARLHLQRNPERMWGKMAHHALDQIRALVHFHSKDRRDIRREKGNGRETFKIDDHEPGPFSLASFRDSFDHCLEHLPERDRAILKSFLSEGVPMTELARQVNCSPSTVRRALAKANQAMQDN